MTLISLYRPQIEAQYDENVFKSLVSAYQIGGMVGSLLFGLLAFVLGRRKIFLVLFSLLRSLLDSTSLVSSFRELMSILLSLLSQGLLQGLVLEVSLLPFLLESISLCLPVLGVGSILA